MKTFYVSKDNWGEMYHVSTGPRGGILSDFCIRDFERFTGIKLKENEGKWFKLQETTKPKKAGGKAKK